MLKHEDSRGHHDTQPSDVLHNDTQHNQEEWYNIIGC
jgi:hypothetical protein